MKQFTGYMRGVNLGGWYSQCDYSKDRLENFIKEEDFAVIAGWGADHVRMPVDYNIFEDESGNYIESGFDYVQRVIDWCEKNGLNMVLDLHKTAGYSFDDKEDENGFFDNEAMQDRFCRLWEEFARRFGKYSDRVAFELLNEVTEKKYSPIWNAIAARCIDRIRAICKDVKILVGSYFWNDYNTVEALDPPRDENVVYNFHCYSPMLFTHQNAAWVQGMPRGFVIGYPEDTAVYEQACCERAPEMRYRMEPTKCERYSAQFFIEQFAGAVKVAEERGTALYCGEYGVINNADPEDTLAWYKDINEAFEHYGIGRAAWSYRSMSFGLADEHLKPVIDRLVKYL